MRTFTCTCGNTVYFDNTQCVKCGRTLGFDAEQLKIVSIQPVDDLAWQSVEDTGRHYRQCKHYRVSNVCNWLVPADDNNAFCRACRLNSVIPDLSKENNVHLWYRLEKAKRRLIYTLLSLHLPITSYRTDEDHGLAFRFMEDVTGFDAYKDEMVTYEQIMTGHHAGTITININEADDIFREEMREKMNESYRTILGHFRHEIGHYYWDRLIARTDLLDEFRLLFGDERNDYKTALDNYYQYGPAPAWSYDYISAYASAHPWEDWAETWAHYLHFVDILETAGHHHIGLHGEEIQQGGRNIYDWLGQNDFDSIISLLGELLQTLNELNRSLGLADPYPFKHTPNVIKKLEYVHRIVMSH